VLGALRRLGRPRSGSRFPPDTELLSRVEELERRLVHLESALEGLQDAVYRESVRRNEQTAELQRRTAPDELARALSKDARERGL
jgi:hypothetical protein